MEYRVFKLSCPEDYREIFIAELSAIGFEMLQELEDGVEAYSESTEIENSDIESILDRYSALGVSGHWTTVENANWNEEWEKNYDPVLVDGRCFIHADFHKTEEHYEFDLLINPRMSFGTGHHATTFLMTRASFDLDFKGKTVLDAGCGTGVLAILAEKMGAEKIMAYDISRLCSENTIENCEANKCSRIEVQTGTVEEVNHFDNYDIIYANINKNILLEEIQHFEPLLAEGGKLLISGFFAYDAGDLLEEAKRCGLQEVKTYEKDGWNSVVLQRQ